MKPNPGILLLKIPAMFLLCTATYADPHAEITNLKNQSFPQQLVLTQALETSYQASELQDAYQLSMPLLASAQQGNEKLYHEILPKIQKALDDTEENEQSRKAWLMGRILLAANNIGDHSTSTATQSELTQLLNSKNMPKNAFSAWAWAYLASANQPAYQQAKAAMLNAATTLSANYHNHPSDNALSDSTWAWIMNLQAAANAQDSVTYHAIINHLKQLTHEPSITLAIATGLSPKDYRAWGLSIALLSAAIMKDKKSYQELKVPTLSAIKTANQQGFKNEEMLAEANFILAGLRFKN